MLNYIVLSKKPEHFRNFSGLTIKEFSTLNQTINEKHPAYEQNRPQRPNRKRNISAGHPYKQTLTDLLLMLLTYYHPYTSSTLLSYLFGVNQSEILKNIRHIKPSSAKPCPYQTKNTKKSKNRVCEET
jgi:hypothetical protein